MTYDPEKFWPGGIVLYRLDSSLSKISIISLMHDDFLHVCIITQHTSVHISLIALIHTFTFQRWSQRKVLFLS